MKKTRLIMGMPITIEIINKKNLGNIFSEIFDYFIYIDKTFSTYKKSSEISQINLKKKLLKDASSDILEVLRLSDITKKETNGYFDIKRNGKIDPSGIVKGWAIYKATLILKNKKFKNFSINAGGDIQVFGKNKKGENWKTGIQNPFNTREIIKILSLTNKGIATSGSYIRGAHIYNPKKKNDKLINIVSITVIGPNVYEADRFATAAFAMQEKGISFIESLKGFEAYMIRKDGTAFYTDGFDKFVLKDV